MDAEREKRRAAGAGADLVRPVDGEVEPVEGEVDGDVDAERTRGVGGAR